MRIQEPQKPPLQMELQLGGYEEESATRDIIVEAFIGKMGEHHSTCPLYANPEQMLELISSMSCEQMANATMHAPRPGFTLQSQDCDFN